MSIVDRACDGECYWASQIEDDRVVRDKLYITEILNDMGRRGQLRDHKSDEMLRVWSAELREVCRAKFPASRLRKIHARLCCARNW